jgi:DNA-binding cell septation regulator SpoVG
MQGPTGLFGLFPAKKAGGRYLLGYCFSANTETRRIIEQAILAEYKKAVAEGDAPLITTANK